MAKYRENGLVVAQERIATDTYSIWIEAKQIAAEATAGQFVNMVTGDGSKILPRPISICGIDKEKGVLRIVYHVTGKGTGTEIFSKKTAGDEIIVMGPMGTGFPTERTEDAILIGGGIGIAPMLQLAKDLNANKQIVLGYRDELFLNEEFEPYGTVSVATDSGSAGTKGNVIDAIRENQIKGDVIYACGPTPMLRAVKAYAEENGILCYISLEQRMACGIGACLACVCQSKEIDEHSQVHNKRVCKEGPVFLSTEVEL